jgi:TonB family protein
MLCATILALTLFMVASKAPPSAALPILAPLPAIESPQLASPDDGRGDPGSDFQSVGQRPNPDASGKYHVGDGVSPPKLVFAPDPEFTDKARHKRVAGTVVVALTVDVAGKPQDVRVSRSLATDVSKKLQPIAQGLDENAVKAVKQYHFEPAEFRGKPVPVEITVEVHYRIN